MDYLKLTIIFVALTLKSHLTFTQKRRLICSIPKTIGKILESRKKSGNFSKCVISNTCFFIAKGDFVPLVNKNGVPAVELGFSKILFENESRIYIVEGRIDLISKFEDKLFFTDHKTQGTKKDLYGFKTQFLTYAWATGLSDGLINYVGTTKEPNKDTFRRQHINFPKHMIDLWKDQMTGIFNDIYYQTHELSEKAPIENSDRAFGRRLTSCAGAFESNPCQYIPICTSQTLEMKQSIKKFNFVESKIWRPWE